MGHMCSVAAGASVNCQVVSFSPHLHTTHTEALSHILPDPYEYMARTDWISTTIPTDKILAVFLRLTPSMISPEGDFILDQADVQVDVASGKLLSLVHDKDDDDDGDDDEHSIQGGKSNVDGWTCCTGSNAIKSNQVEAIIIAMYPNGLYPSDRPQRYFSPESITKILTFFPRAKHLLTDAPSMDKACDRGLLASHRTFWNRHPDGTITEMCHLQNLPFENGTLGMLQMQVLPIGNGADAVPSRPLFSILQ